MRICQTWSISLERVNAFLCSLEEIRQYETGRFSYKGCEISAVALPDRKMGSLSFPSTQISFCGEDADTEEVYRRFFYQFISAGA